MGFNALIYYQNMFHGKKHLFILIPLVLSCIAAQSGLPKNERISIQKRDDSQKYKIATYYSSWSHFHGKYPSDIPLEYINTIYFAFPKIDKTLFDISWNDEPMSTSRLIELKNYNTSQIFSVGIIGQLQQLKSISPDLQVSLTVGGQNTAALFSIILADKAKLKKFISQLIGFVYVYNFDGIDLDWEFPRNKDERRQLLYLSKLLKLSLQRLGGLTHKHYTLSIALPADVNDLQHVNFQALDNYTDVYNIMGYDLCGSWSKTIDFHSNLNRSKESMGVNDVIIHLIKERSIDSKKIMLGMPNFGKSYNIKKKFRDMSKITSNDIIGTKFSGCGGVVSKLSDHEDAKQCIIDYNYIDESSCSVRIFDDLSISTMCYNSKESSVIVYDSVEVSRAKAKYVKNMNLGGGVFWDSKADHYKDNEGSSLLINFANELLNSSDPELEEYNHIMSTNSTYIFGALRNFTSEEIKEGMFTLEEKLYCNSFPDSKTFYKGYYSKHENYHKNNCELSLHHLLPENEWDDKEFDYEEDDQPDSMKSYASLCRQPKTLHLCLSVILLLF